MNPYLADILSQPQFLRKVVQHWQPDSLRMITDGLKNGSIDRIVITGMGASYNAAYPAMLQLSRLPVPVQLINAAELVHFLPDVIGERTLLWVNSQSGRSAELVSLFKQHISRKHAGVLACVNDPESPTAGAADIFLHLQAGPESTVSTKTFVNTMALNLLIANHLLGSPVQHLAGELLDAADQLEGYLLEWDERMEQLRQLLGEFDTLALLGRGPSMAAVWNGALVNKEAAKYPLEGMNSADFRHGPLELVRPGFTGLIYSGSAKVSSLNHVLAADIRRFGGKAIVFSREDDKTGFTMPIPAGSEATLPIAEIVAAQLLSFVLAERTGVVPGKFIHSGKVTTVE
jgi:glucosamine--fructose-6-phosphate aminotransferase (isomerizing)